MQILFIKSCLRTLSESLIKSIFTFYSLTMRKCKTATGDFMHNMCDIIIKKCGIE